MTYDTKRARAYADAVRVSGLSIYDPVEVGHSQLWIPSVALEVLLRRELIGLSLSDLPLRTRSRVVKEHVCRAMGYPVPRSFRRSRPRFPGQLLDTYVQKSNNLQIWNEALAPTRRYALIRVSGDHVITQIRVVSGETLGCLATTGTLTRKYQARLVPGRPDRELITPLDTEVVRLLTNPLARIAPGSSATDWPGSADLLPIAKIFEMLSSLVGTIFPDTGCDQERNRGGALHKLVCRRLGYKSFRDVGQFPDIRHQLLEVKLQTSPTIDLGLVCPDQAEDIGLPPIMGRQVRHCDVRYAIFYAVTDGLKVRLEKLFVTTGQCFFERFPRFEGQIVNKKLQIHLPRDFFDV